MNSSALTKHWLGVGCLEHLHKVEGDNSIELTQPLERSIMHVKLQNGPMAKTDRAFTTRDWSGLVYKIVSLCNIDFSFIIHI